MQYKNLDSLDPQEKTRILRRLWKVQLFDGPAEDGTPIIEETIVAMSEMEVHRLTGSRELAHRPESLHYVTWPHLDDPGGPIYRIDNTTDGPYGEPIQPSIPLPESDEWNF